ncbi:MAG: glycosyltransferase [Candidatus Binatia bacterium]
MRIAQVITLFLPDFVGGATLACNAMAQRLRARGHDVSVFCGRPHGDAPAYEESAWDVEGLPVSAVNAAPGYAALDARSYRHPETAPAFARFLERTRPDVVHFHSIQALGANLLEVAAAHGVPVVVTMHDWWWWCARMFLVDQHDFVCPQRVASERCHCAPGCDLVGRRAYLTAMLAHADRVLTPSRFLADAAIANGVPPERVAVSENGVTPFVGGAARRPGPIRFGYFGGPDHRMKGLPTLLAAADRAGCGGFELVLYVGTSAPRARLTRQLTDRVGLTLPIPLTIDDRVVLRPSFAPAELPGVLAELDCLIVPSLMRESFSLVTREALAAGVPVIATDSGGPTEVIRPERNGLVCATGDAADLATCLRRFVLEPGLAATLRAGAAATPTPSLDRQVADLEAIYTDVQSAVPHRAPDAGLRGPVLFLAGCDGAPFRYRVTHLRDALAARGVASRALWWTDPSVPAAIADAAIVVVYRVPMSPWLDACLAHARALGTPLAFSCDDLVFDPSATPHDALAALPEGQRTWWLAATERYAATLRACDAFLATTEPLAAAATRLGVPAFVVRNGLGEHELAVAERLRKTQPIPRADDGRIVLAYFSGTTMHDLDFAVAAPALARVLAERPQARLRIGGHLRTHPALATVADQVERLPFMPWPDMLAALATSDVQLAPLRLGDPFTDAKSAVKYLEAAALGVPTIASPTDAFRRAIRSGENGLLAATPDEWETQLGSLIDDAGARRRLGNRARDDVFLHATPAAQADALIAALGAMGGSKRAAAPPVRDAPDPARFAEVGHYDLAPDDLLPGTAVEVSDTPSVFLIAGRTVGQRFTATADGLCRIDVRVGTDGRRSDHALRFALSDSPGTHANALRQATTEALSVADGAWIALAFDPIADSAGRDFYFWLESSAATSTITLWTYAQGHGDTPPSGLCVDHASSVGSLAFRTFNRAPRQ